GFFPATAPPYGGSSLLGYNTGTSYGRGNEWLPNATSGQGYPHSVQISGNTNFNLVNGNGGIPFWMSGDLTVDASSVLNLNAGGGLTQPLTILGSVTNNGQFANSGQVGGDVNVGGNLTNTG